MYILDWGELLPWQQCDITYYKHIDTMTSLLGNSLLWVHICPRWCKEQIPDPLSSWFKCSPMSIYCFHCTVSGCDGGNRTRNIAVYTWCLSTLSYNRHLLSYNHHPLSYNRDGWFKCWCIETILPLWKKGASAANPAMGKSTAQPQRTTLEENSITLPTIYPASPR
jgi:hypothetical protein